MCIQNDSDIGIPGSEQQQKKWIFGLTNWKSVAIAISRNTKAYVKKKQPEWRLNEMVTNVIR